MKLDYEVAVKITVIAESESEAEEMVKDFLHVPYQLSPNEIEKYEVGYAYHSCEECHPTRGTAARNAKALLEKNKKRK